MTDNELRGIVLARFYDLRHEEDGFTQLPEIVKLDPTQQTRIANICDQLAEHGLLSWKPIKALTGTVGGIGKITAFGVDVIEKTSKPPIAITVHDKSINVHNSSSVQIGNNNTQGINIGSIYKAIEDSTASNGEKADAKSILAKLAATPLFGTIVSAIIANAGSLS